MRYITIALAVVALTGCAQVVGFLDQGAMVIKDQINDYCFTVSQSQRELLRSQLVWPDGTPMVVVNCPQDSPAALGTDTI